MEFLKRSWVQTQAFLSQLSVTARWLMGCLLIIFLLLGWLLMQYAANPELVPITQFAAEHGPEVAARLGRSGIQVRMEGGQLQVPLEHYDQAMVILLGSDLLASDTVAAFDEMIARQSPWQSSAQNAQVFLLAKQKVLGQIIGKMVGVKSASVMLSMPDKQGFGTTYVRPSASVNVIMSASKRVDKRLVEAIAGLVSGAVAEMTSQDVVVIDANRGRQFTVKSPDDVLPGETMELVQQLEHRYREKVSQVLSYIPGVIIAVNARVDPVHTKRIEEYDYEESEPLRSEFSRETERQDKATAGEPGARPNTGLDIAGANEMGRFERINESRNEFNEKNLTRRTHTTESGHMVKQVSVTINVPRLFFVAVHKQSQPEEEASEPNDEALQPVIQQQLSQIQAQVEPLVDVEGNGGVVRVHMIPDRHQLMAVAGVVGGAGTVGGLSGVLGSRWAKPLGLAALALASLAMMFGMVRKATQPPSLPSADELAGIPPKLPGEDQITGEAAAANDEMIGMEMTEEEIESRRIADQIADMINENPVEAAALVNRWVSTEE